MTNMRYVHVWTVDNHETPFCVDNNAQMVSGRLSGGKKCKKCFFRAEKCNGKMGILGYKTSKKWEWLAKTDFSLFSEEWGCHKDLCSEREFQLTPKMFSSGQRWSSIFLRQILKISLGSSPFPVSISPPQYISHLCVRRGVWHQNILCLQRQSRFKMPVNRFVERRFSTLRIDIFPQTLMTFLSDSNMILSQTLMMQLCFFWGLKWVFSYKHGAIGRRYGLRRWWIECWQSLPGNENNVILLKSESGNGRSWQQGSTSQKRNELFDKLDWVALGRVGK